MVIPHILYVLSGDWVGLGPCVRRNYTHRFLMVEVSGKKQPSFGRDGHVSHRAHTTLLHRSTWVSIMAVIEQFELTLKRGYGGATNAA